MSEPLRPLDIASLPEPVNLDFDDAALANVTAVIEKGPYDATWESLRRYEAPKWYRDAKFGIFLHWGVQSVPAFAEWSSRDMYLEGSPAFEHHVASYGNQKDFGYKDFIPSFTMEKFDPDAWAYLFRKAGAQFIVPVAEHHDGFAMYDTQRSRWKAPAMGPKRDVFGDLLAAGKRSSMIAGASSHRAEHWFFMNGGARFDSDVLDPTFIDFYGPAQREETSPHEQFLQDWLLRTVEIIDRYQPQVLWFDWWIEHPAFKPYLLQLAAYYYNRAAEWGREVVINYKWDAFAEGSAVYDIERGTMGGIRPDVWQNDTSVSKTAWFYVEGHDYKRVDDIIAELVDVVAKNGVLLLNIGPKADGTIAESEVRLLESIGQWLSRNGEAIYGTRPWIIPSEGPTEQVIGSFVDGETPVFTAADIRFTTRAHVTGDFLYATLLSSPSDSTARIRAWGTGAGLLSRQIKEVTVLGHKRPLQWRQTVDALEVAGFGDVLEGSGPVIKVFLQPEATQPRGDSLHG